MLRLSPFFRTHREREAGYEVGCAPGLNKTDNPLNEA